jgi:transcriptional regulator with XRE-family HTH domain
MTQLIEFEILREGEQLSQHKLACLVNISNNTVTHVQFVGLKRPLFDTIYKIIAAFIYLLIILVKIAEVRTDD